MQVSNLSSCVLHESQLGYRENFMLKETLGVFVLIMTSVELAVLFNFAEESNLAPTNNEQKTNRQTKNCT